MHLALVTALLLACSYTLAQGPQIDDAEAERRMRQFGHLPEVAAQGAHASLTDMREGYRSYQRSMGLDQTGELDAATKAAMALPRCGVKDVDSSSRRKRRFSAGQPWPRNSLTYKIINYTPDIPERSQVDSEIRRAFKVWSDVTPLIFTQIFSGTADIDIRFVAGAHNFLNGDGPFDGPSGVLAHAFFPNTGDAHFDEAERWTINTFSGINLFQVAAHEFGHSLGLGHSNVRSALMYASYRGFQPNFVLDQDDINGIQSNYGKNQVISSTTTPSTSTPPPTTTTTTTSTTTTTTTTTTTSTTTTTTTSRTPPPTTTTRRTSPPTTTTRRTQPTATTTTSQPTGPFDPRDVCSVTKFDAVTTTAEGRTYFFVGNYFYEHVSNNPTESRRPQLISDRWRYVSGPIDAVLTRGRYTVIFQHHSQFGFHGYHTFIGENRADNYFRRTTRFLPNIPTNMDAAWVWGSQNKIYASRGTSYWRYNNGDSSEDSSYPRDFNQWWPSAPETIDAAYTDQQGVLHFIEGDRLHTFSNYYDRVIRVASVSQTLFGCASSFQNIVYDNDAGSDSAEENSAATHEDPNAAEDADDDNMFGALSVESVDAQNIIDLVTSSAPLVRSAAVLLAACLASLLLVV